MANDTSYLSPGPIGDLAWDPEKAEESLQKVFTHVIGDAEAAIRWYAENRAGKRRGGLASRGLAVILIAAAGLLPIVSQLLNTLRTPRYIDPLLATFAIGAAAALVGFDQRFGWSSGWMRYVSTSMAIRTALEAFEIDWICQRAALHGDRPKPDQINEMLAKCKEFTIKLNSIVAEETNIWVQEFQATLKQIDEAVKTAQEDEQKRAERVKAAMEEAERRAEAKKAGAINLSLANRSQVTGKWTVQVDQGEMKEYSGTTAALSPVDPGLRTVRVFGIVGGEEKREEKTVNVPSGAILDEKFTL